MWRLPATLLLALLAVAGAAAEMDGIGTYYGGAPVRVFLFFLLIFLAARHAPARCVSVCARAAPGGAICLAAPARACSGPA
jgi:hypothetical protein